MYRHVIPRGVQKDPKPKIRTENPIPEPIFRVPDPKYLVFSVRVLEPIIYKIIGSGTRTEKNKYFGSGTRKIGSGIGLSVWVFGFGYF